MVGAALEQRHGFHQALAQRLTKAALPMVAAVGGMLLPAGIYLLLQSGEEGQRGWGIPMATDIAFAVGVLTLLVWTVPLWRRRAAAR